MKRIVLIVGVPGAGKTTLAKRLIEHGYVSLNADEIRKELWGDPTDQREPQKVFELLHNRLDELLAQGADIVLDNKNINVGLRRDAIQRAIKAGYKDIQLWILDVPLERCLKQNRERDRYVPDEIVINSFNMLQGAGKPRKHEGKLVLVRPGEKDFEFRFFQMK